MDLLPLTYVGAVLIVWELVRERQGRPPGGFDLSGYLQVSPLRLRVAILMLAPLFGVQLQLLYYQALHENGGPVSSAFAGMPIPVYIGRTYDPSMHWFYSAIAGLIALAEILCLAIIVTGLARVEDGTTRTRLLNRTTLACIGVALVAVAAQAVFAPALSTTDPYQYLQAVDTGWKTYANDSGAPTAGWIYGPLWLILATAVSSVAHSVVGRIVALRIFNAVLLCATVALLRAARLPIGAQAVFALNPAIWFEDVANPHLEIWGLFFIATSYACATRLRAGSLLAALAQGAAGLIKLPFIVLGAASSATLNPLWRRCAIVAGAILVTVAVSWLFSGAGYFANVSHFAQQRSTRVEGWDYRVRMAFLVFALLATAFGFLRGRNFVGMAWLAPQLAVIPFPWYSIWGFAFVLENGSWLTAFLVSLPLLQVSLDFNYDVHRYGWILVLAAVAFVTTNLMRPEAVRATR